MRRKLNLLALLLAASFTAVPAALAQVPLVSSTVSVNGIPSPAGTTAGYVGFGKNGTGDQDFFAANNGSSPSFYWYFLLGSTLTPEMFLDMNANFHVPNGGITTQSVTATVSTTLPHYTVATLPSPVTIGAGGTVVISDCTTTTVGPLCTGGGTNYMLAISNGTVWTTH